MVVVAGRMRVAIGEGAREQVERASPRREGPIR